MPSTSMTPPTPSTVTDGQQHVEFDWLLDSENLDWELDILSSDFSTLDGSPGSEVSFEDPSLQIQSTGETQEFLLPESSSLPGDDVVSIAVLDSTTATPLDISALENLERHTSVDVESSTATVQTLEV
jgi:hypothetical protein